METAVDTALRLLGAALILTGLVARLRDRALPTGALAFVGFVIAEIPELLASNAR